MAEYKALDEAGNLISKPHEITTNATNTAGAIARITKEIHHIQKSSDLSLAVAFQENDVRQVRALIIGPPETPYEFGFFEFAITFPKSYPITSPGVVCLTTNGGRCRFNPNIYNCGKVCLSILGTWRGEPGEEWSSAQGLESVLISVQSLMSANPYENEPGFEEYGKDEDMPQAYIKKIRHEALRISVLQRLEGLLGIEEGRGRVPGLYKKIRDQTKETLFSKSPSPVPPPSTKIPHNNDDSLLDGTYTPTTDPSPSPSPTKYDAEATFTRLLAEEWDPFADLLKRRFLWYYDTYAKTIETAKTEQSEGTTFKTMDFEGGANSMPGKFMYKKLEERLKGVAAALEEERRMWEGMGREQVKAETGLAVQLAFTFRQLKFKWDAGNPTNAMGSRLEINLPDAENPFVWHLTLFGGPNSKLDSGIFNLVLSIPPTFPEAQPRVKVETPIFHHRVASSGILCYFPQKEDEIGSHLQAIVSALEDENPTYDPRAVVNPGAFALYWGGDEKRKFYNRKLRRSAQDSSEV